MSVLIISEKDRHNIQIAVNLARANPVPLEALEGLMNATPDHRLPFEETRAQLADEVYKRYPTQSFLLGNVRVAFSFEYQPSGLMRHLSVALNKPRSQKVPNYEVVKMVALEFGFSDFPPKKPYRIWSEEFEPKRFAVNIIELEEERHG
jgi:hypothetical protein